MDKKSSHPPSSQHNLHRNYCGTNPTNPADLNLIAAALSLSGFCSQGHLIDTCEKSGYSLCDDVDLLEVVL